MIEAHTKRRSECSSCQSGRRSRDHTGTTPAAHSGAYTTLATAGLGGNGLAGRWRCCLSESEGLRALVAVLWALHPLTVAPGAPRRFPYRGGDERVDDGVEHTSDVVAVWKLAKQEPHEVEADHDVRDQLEASTRRDLSSCDGASKYLRKHASRPVEDVVCECGL